MKKSKSNGKEASGKKSKGKAAASMASHDADTFRESQSAHVPFFGWTDSIWAEPGSLT